MNEENAAKKVDSSKNDATKKNEDKKSNGNASVSSDAAN